MSLCIPISKEEKEYILDGRSPEKTNQVFKSFWTATEGEERAFFNGKLKRFRLKPENSEQTYISRYCIADHLGWESSGYASKFLKSLRANPGNSPINLQLIEKETDANGTYCWTVTPEKITQSIIEATEGFFFELTETEKEIVGEIVRKREKVLPTIFGCRGEFYVYNLIESYVAPFPMDNETHEQVVREIGIEDAENGVELLQKYDEASEKNEYEVDWDKVLEVMYERRRR